MSKILPRGVQSLVHKGKLAEVSGSLCYPGGMGFGWKLKRYDKILMQYL